MPAVLAAIFRYVYLYWAGSIIFSLANLLPGGTIGEYSHELQLSSFLNAPYILVPLVFLKRVFDTPRPVRSIAYHSRTLDTLFAAIFMLVMGVLYVRFAACMGSEWGLAVIWRDIEPTLLDPSGFFKVFGVVGLYYHVSSPASIPKTQSCLESEVSCVL